MTKQELQICDKLKEIYEEYRLLPVQHPSDVIEFATAIHACQNIVMCRDAVRNHPETFFSLDK